MIPLNLRKKALLNSCKRVRRLLGNEYLNISDDEFKEAIHNNIYLQDIEDAELLETILNDNELEIEEFPCPRKYSDLILDDLKEAVLNGDTLDILDYQCEYIAHLEQLNDFLGQEILQLWVTISNLKKGNVDKKY